MKNDSSPCLRLPGLRFPRARILHGALWLAVIAYYLYFLAARFIRHASLADCCAAGFQFDLMPVMGWSGRAPAPPAMEAGKGRQRRGARQCHASSILESPSSVSISARTPFTWWGAIN